MSNTRYSKVYGLSYYTDIYVSAFKRSDSSMIRFKCCVLAILYKHNCEHCKWYIDGNCEGLNYIGLYNVMK